MTHLDGERLAGAALGEPDALGRRDRWHLSRCAACRGELAELGRLVAAGRSGPPEPLRPPRPGLLAAVRAELDADAAAEPVRAAERPPVDVPGRVARRRPVRWLVAAGVVVVVGVAAAVTYRETREDVVASAVLAPLPAHAGHGTAQVVRDRDGQELSVAITTAPPADRFEELWLLSSDGRGMISVGIVPPTGRATFPLPPEAAALDSYTVVDVSLEPYDGNPAHSRNSVLRGTLR